MKGHLYILVLSLVFYSYSSSAQTDSLVFKDGQSMVGEIKSMSWGKLVMETEFSDSDFSIDWLKVHEIYGTHNFLVSLANGNRFDARLKSTQTVGKVELIGAKSRIVNLSDIVFIKPVSESFWDRVSANIDVGYNITKSQNLVQFNTRTALGYLARRWEATGNYNNVYSQQDSVGVTRRMDANLTFKLFLPKDFFLFVSNDFLSNDEQKLQLRSTSKLGLGNYIAHTNTIYWALFGGLAYNNETFTEEINPPKQTGEVFLGTEFNMYNTGDFGIKTSVIAYPNLTDKGRVRADFKFDLTYDLPLDFYIKAGTTINYDNQPVAGGSEVDYVIQTGVGWSW